MAKYGKRDFRIKVSSHEGSVVINVPKLMYEEAAAGFPPARIAIATQASWSPSNIGKIKFDPWNMEIEVANEGKPQRPFENSLPRVGEKCRICGERRVFGRECQACGTLSLEV